MKPHDDRDQTNRKAFRTLRSKKFAKLSHYIVSKIDNPKKHGHFACDVPVEFHPDVGHRNRRLQSQRQKSSPRIFNLDERAYGPALKLHSRFGPIKNNSSETIKTRIKGDLGAAARRARASFAGFCDLRRIRIRAVNKDLR